MRKPKTKIKKKTKRAAVARFKLTASGTVKRNRSMKRHILTKKATGRKRHLRSVVGVHETNMGHVAQMLPFAGL